MENLNNQTNNERLTMLTAAEIDELLLQYKDIDYAFPKLIVNNQKPINTVEKLKELTRKVNEASAQVEEIFKHIREKDSIPLKEVTRDLIPIIKQASEEPNVYFLFEDLQEKDEYTYRHNICVAVISAMLGKWLGYNEDQIREIELAGLFHDIGKTKVPYYLLHKQSKLSPSEVEEMKKHTIYGYKLIKNTSNLSDEVALVALQHHERMDGKGYPFQLKRERIHPYTRIISVADVFHALSSDRIYRQAIPFYQVISHMNDTLYGRFDPHAAIVFLNKMTEMLVGKTVQLNNGQLGTIVMNNQYRPLRSVILLNDGEIIDLQKQPDLHIEKVVQGIQR